jgi:glycosyltransferase involved in cell wall biosynthesis
MATIGIDVTALSTPASGGIGSSQYEILRALTALTAPHCFVLFAAEPPLVPFTDRPLDVDMPVRLGKGITARSNILWMQTGVNRLLAEEKVDLFWSPRHLLPFRAPRTMALVATVQDFWHLHHPEQQPFVNRTLNRALIGRITRRADHIVTTSSAVAADAFEHYGLPRERLTVVPLGVDGEIYHRLSPDAAEAVLERLGVQAPFLLAMDVFNPRKNFRTLLEAFATLPQAARQKMRVVGLGRPRATAADAAPVAIAERLGIADRLMLLPDVSREDLIALYSSATAFVYPSVYEGFGMPVLEAMACGCPVIAADRASLPEVAGNAAVLVDPDDPRALAAELEALLADSARLAGLREAGLRRASEMTWARTAEGMLRVFDRVLAERAGRA